MQLPTPRELMNAIWDRSDGERVFLPYRDRDQEWHEDGGWDLPITDSVLDAMTDGKNDYGDLYFTPLVFNGNRRSNENVGSIGVLFADLDYAEPSKLVPASAVWETSPGSLQAVWFMGKMFQNYAQWSVMNRAMTYFTGADKGGWMGSKVLRVPGSKNWKRAGVVGEILSYNPEYVYDPGKLEEFFYARGYFNGAADVVTTPVPDGPVDLNTVDWDNMPYNLVYWLRIAPNLKNLGRSPGARLDRSQLIWELIVTFRDEGVDKHTTFLMLKDAPFNKWRTNPSQLWRQIELAYQVVK
jgi:hypothetical protein